jgi:hypothetical protein
VSRTAAALAAVLLAAGAAASDGDAEALARFRRAFDPAAPADAFERAAAAAALFSVEGRAGPEAVCRALAWTLERSESLAVERTRAREELARLRQMDEDAGNTTTPERKSRIEALRSIEESLRDKGDDERRVEDALRPVLGRFRDPKALDWMAGSGLRGTASGAVRAAIADALGLSGTSDPNVIRSVRGALKDRDPQVREAAVRALSLLRPKEDETLKDLAASLEDSRWMVRLTAARRLAERGVPESVDLLVARLAKEDGHVARLLGELLESLTGQRFGAEADGWRHWWQDNRAAYASGAKALTPGAPPVARAGEDGGGDPANYYGIPVKSRRILFVIDISGSMNKPGSDPKATKVDEAKRELLRCIKTLDGGSSFGVFAFGDTVKKWKPGIVKAAPEARDDAKRWIDALVANAWTNTYAALEEGLRISAADPRNNMGEDYGTFADTIFLLTDGSPTDPSGKAVDAGGKPEWPRVLEAVRGWNREKRVAIHCIGVGPEVNDQFLSTLASENGGTCVRVR